MSVVGVILSNGPHSSAELSDLGPALLLPLLQRPLIEHTLQSFEQAGVADAVVCVKTGAATIAAALERLGRADVPVLMDQVPRGPAGAARDALTIAAADHYLICNALVRIPSELPALVESHRAEKRAMTIGVWGAAGDRDAEPVDIFALSHEALEQVSLAGYHDLKEGLAPRLHANGEIVDTFAFSTRPLSLKNLSRWLVAVKNRLADPGEHARLEAGGFVACGDVWRHQSARVASSARLVGPVVIGRDAVIEADAVLVGPIEIGPNAVVGKGAFVWRSMLAADCRVSAGAAISDAWIHPGETAEVEVAPSGAAAPAFVEATPADVHKRVTA